jgi:hypothetical protein
MTWLDIVIGVVAIALIGALLTKPKRPDPPDDIYTLY